VPTHDTASQAALRAQAFYDVLGQEAALEENLGALLGYAKRSGLVVNEADYDRVESAPGGFVEQGGAIPFTGAHGDLRSFCELALLRMPFAALDSIQVRRNTVSAEAVEARLHFTLYLRSGGAPATRVTAVPVRSPDAVESP